MAVQVLLDGDGVHVILMMRQHPQRPTLETLESFVELGPLGKTAAAVGNAGIGRSRVNNKTRRALECRQCACCGLGMLALAAVPEGYPIH